MSYPAGENNILQSLVRGLTDCQLAHLARLVREEERARIQMRIEAGQYPPLTEEEAELVRTSRAMTIKAYKERTGVSLTEAIEIVEMERQ